MAKTTSSITILKQFALLEKKASREILKSKANIEKKIAKEVAAVHKKYRKELKQVENLLSRFGLSSPASKASKSVNNLSGKRLRRPSVTDEQIKAQLSKLLAGGKQVSSAVIFKNVGIGRPRFTAFLKANKSFLQISGKKRSTLYSLKG